MKKLLAFLTLASLASSAIAGQQIKPTDIFGYPNIATGISGNAATATTSTSATTATSANTLTTPRTFSLTGDVISSGCSFDGSADCTIAATLANTSTARTNLGLGTAAVVNTGTSGSTIPLLNTSVTWSGSNQTIYAPSSNVNLLLESDANANIQVRRASADASGPQFITVKGRGSIASQTPVLTNDAIGTFTFNGIGAIGSSAMGASLSAVVTDPSPSATSMGSKIVLSTSAVGSVAPSAALTLDSLQNATFPHTVTASVVSIPDPTVAGTIDALRLTNTGTQSIGTAVGISFDPRNAGVGVRDAQIVASTATAGGSASLHFRIANGVPPVDTWVMGMAGDFYCASCGASGNLGQITATRFNGPVTGTLTGNFASARTFTYTGDVTGGPTSFDGSANVTTATTLATTQAAVHTWSANQTFGSLVLLHGYTVATLPTCNSGTQGGYAYVTDALLPTFMATIAGGGTNKVSTFCNGTNWIAS